jgi:hypothetical protein
VTLFPIPELRVTGIRHSEFRSAAVVAAVQIVPEGQLTIRAASVNVGSVRPKMMQIATTQITQPTVMIAASWSNARRLACVAGGSRFIPSPGVTRCVLFRWRKSLEREDG